MTRRVCRGHRARLCVALALTFAGAGCGPIGYVGTVSHRAADAVDAARAAGADTLAPYWWTRATQYLAMAREVAAHADFQGANRFGRLAAEAAEQARAEAERELQTVRSQLEQLRLQAEVVLPAETGRRVRELVAAGEAAAIAERGQAVAAGLALVQQAWLACGDKAMDMVVAQNLEAIVGQAADAAAAVHAREATLIDPGDGRAVARYVSGYPATVAALLRELGTILGVDLLQSLSGKSGEDPGAPRTATTTTIEVEREAA